MENWSYFHIMLSLGSATGTIQAIAWLLLCMSKNPDLHEIYSSHELLTLQLHEEGCEWRLSGSCTLTILHENYFCFVLF